MIDASMAIDEVVELYPKTKKVFASYGINCAGWAADLFEDLTQVAAAYGISLDQLLNDLNEVI